MRTNKRNSFGVKSSSDQYRTIAGSHFECWTADTSEFEREKQIAKSLGLRTPFNSRSVVQGGEMTREHIALLEIIQQFKPQEISDIQACLNIISRHAAEITRLRNGIEELVDELKNVSTIVDKADELLNREIN